LNNLTAQGLYTLVVVGDCVTRDCCTIVMTVIEFDGCL
jgi:hypothetical protein